jgi:hypothetical protein
MLNKAVWALGLGLMLTASPAWATEAKIEIRQEINQNNGEVKYNKQEVRTSVSGDAKVSVKINGEEMATGTGKLSQEQEQKMEDWREALRKKFEEFKENLQKKREEALSRFQMKREEFKKEMGELKDVRKKGILERVDAR